jgi:hypothetical protein
MPDVDPTVTPGGSIRSSAVATTALPEMRDVTAAAERIEPQARTSNRLSLIAPEAFLPE